ncbi:unnamed protein product, partial [Brassica oleracea var. botrytis]
IAVINQYRACATLSFSPEQDRPVAVITKLRLHPTNAARVQLPDGSLLNEGLGGLKFV